MGRACELIAQQTRAIAQSQQFCLTLGGDHSIAAGSLSGLLQAHPDLAVVWVDAHGDYNTPDTSPSGNFHGMPLAALTGAFPLADAPGFDFFSAALPPERVALVGVRSLDPGEQQLLLDRGLHVFTMSEIDRYGIGRVMEAALAAVAPDGTAPLHLSLDIDALDPSIAPATGTRVAGGLTYREAHFIAEAMAETGRLVSMDLVEVNPQLATAEADPTLHLAIELVESALGKRILSPRRL
jgi:arginase